MDKKAQENRLESIAKNELQKTQQLAESDFVKALALGADAIAVSNSAIQAIGCLGMRACHTNNCPVGVATQKKDAAILHVKLKTE